MRDFLRTIAYALIAVIDGAWVVHVADRCDYNEPALLLLGAVGLLAMACIRWEGQVAFRAAGIVFAAVFAFGIGDAAKRVHVEETVYREAVTKAVTAAVAAKIRKMAIETGSSPDCAYPGIGEVFESRGVDPSIRVEREGRDELAWDVLPTKDAWRARYEYVKTSVTGFLLRSSGADRRFETPDDLLRFGDDESPPAAVSNPRPPYPSGPVVVNRLALGLFFRFE